MIVGTLLTYFYLLSLANSDGALREIFNLDCEL